MGGGANRTVAVVLAAGLASRFGGDKLLHPLNGKPLGAHIADTLAAMPLAGRIVVCPAGNEARAGLFSARGFEIVTNDDASRGLASSLALGVKRAATFAPANVLVCLADMPDVPASHLMALVELGAAHEIVATSVGGTKSPPAVFGPPLFAQLTALSGDKGARELLTDAPAVALAPELARDIDTPADLSSAGRGP